MPLPHSHSGSGSSLRTLRHRREGPTAGEAGLPRRMGLGRKGVGEPCLLLRKGLRGRRRSRGSQGVEAGGRVGGGTAVGLVGILEK